MFNKYLTLYHIYKPKTDEMQVTPEKYSPVLTYFTMALRQHFYFYFNLRHPSPVENR